MSALDDLLHQEHTDALDKCILEVWEINGYEYLAEEGLVILADLRSRVAELEAMLSKRNTTLHKQESEIQRLEALTQWQPIETAPLRKRIIVGHSKDACSVNIGNNAHKQVVIDFGFTHWTSMAILPKLSEEK